MTWLIGILNVLKYLAIYVHGIFELTHKPKFYICCPFW